MAQILGPGAHLQAADCVAIVDPLLTLLADARSRGEKVPPRAVAAIEVLAAVADAYRNAQASRAVPPGTVAIPPLPSGDTAPGGWLTTAAAAAISGTSERNVRKRCQRGTLAARKVGETWQIDPTGLAS